MSPICSVLGCDLSLQRAAARAQAKGELVRVLPGVYCPPGHANEVSVRAAAVLAADPDAVITHRAAARLLWWPCLEVRVIDAWRPCSFPAPQPGFRWHRRAIPAELILERGGLRFSNPALTVLDLIPDLGGRAIDEALHARVVTLPALWNALERTPDRRGNAERRRLLRDSRDEPWSEAERALHQIFRSLKLPHRYATNHWVDLGDMRAALDLALPELKLGFEVDGFEYHGTRKAFEHDRDRDSLLAADDWQIVRFSAAMLDHNPAEVARRMLAIVLARERFLAR